MKEQIEKSINKSFKCVSKVRTMNPETFQPVVKTVIEFDYSLELMQDAKALAVTELEMYTMLGKALMESIKQQESLYTNSIDVINAIKNEGV